jgi:hypothetical protein
VVHALLMMLECLPAAAAAAVVWEVIMAAHPWKGMMMGELSVLF